MSVVGIDYDSYGIHAVRIPFEGEPRHTMKTVPLRRSSDSGPAGEWRALLALPRAMADLGDRILSADLPGYSPTAVVYVERGTGTSRRADFLLGAIYGGIVARLEDETPEPCAINSMPLQEWKRAVTGAGLGKPNGNAKKEVAHEAIYAILAAEGWDVDEARIHFDGNLLDAYGIAWAGREFNRRAFEAAKAKGTIAT